MKNIRIAVVPGDGIGPEISKATLDVLTEAAGSFKDRLKLNFVERNIGYELWRETGEYLEIGRRCRARGLGYRHRPRGGNDIKG